MFLRSDPLALTYIYHVVAMVDMEARPQYSLTFQGPSCNMYRVIKIGRIKNEYFRFKIVCEIGHMRQFLHEILKM